MRRSYLWIAIVCCLLVILLTVPVAADGKSQAAGKRDKAPPATQAGPAKSPCVCTAFSAVKIRPAPAAPRRLTGSRKQRKTVHVPSWARPSSRSHASRDAVFLRQALLARYPWLARELRPRLLDGWHIRLIDGDTFAYGTERIRLRGIDTPEVSESGGFEASQRLDLLLREGSVRIVPQALDKYGRTVADVYVNDRNVADILKGEGYAKFRP
jgi:hypothetical protein